MNIIVCIKQVPETDARIAVSDDGRGVAVPEDAWRMNRYDACALAAAAAVKDAAPEPVRIHAVSLGPARVDAVLRRAMGVGADDASHLRCEEDALSSPQVTADRLHRWIRGMPCDLVLCGAVSEDLMQGCTGPMLAERLGWPVACAALSLSAASDGRTVTVEKEADGGMRVTQTLALPSVVTIQSGVYAPRYPVLSRMLKAADAPLALVDATQACAPGQSVVGLRAPAVKASARFFEGTDAEKARALKQLLGRRGWL